MSDTPEALPGALSHWLQQAQARHADDSAAVAAALAGLAGSLGADAEAAEAIRLAEHVCLAHLGDGAALQAFIDRLPAALAQAEATAPGVQRARAALALLAGTPAPPLADALRWRVLQNVLLAMAAQGRCAQAAALLRADEAGAAAHGADAAGKAFAASANNLASHLQAGARDAARDALMLEAAAIARRAWARAGGWMELERADYRLALCHAAADQGAEAVAHARRCLAGVEAGDPATGTVADAVEHFFAHEALVRAYRAAGDAVAAAVSVQRMHALLPAIAKADGLRDWCAQALADLPR